MMVSVPDFAPTSPPEDRRVDVVPAAIRDFLRDRASRQHCGRSHIDDKTARRDSAGDAVVPSHDPFHRRRVRHHHDYDGRALRHLARRCRRQQALRGERVDHFSAAVVDDDLRAGGAKIPAHRSSHQPETDKADDGSREGFGHGVNLTTQAECVGVYGEERRCCTNAAVSAGRHGTSWLPGRFSGESTLGAVPWSAREFEVRRLPNAERGFEEVRRGIPRGLRF